MRSLFRSSLLFVAVAMLAAFGCGRAVPPPSETTVVSEDGFKIAATEYGGGENGVVLIHDVNGSKADWEAFANLLASKGMKVIAINLRGYPGSDGLRDVQVMDRDVTG